MPCPALTQIGFALLGTDADSKYSMRAPLWGTFLVSAEALTLGLPVALALAIVTREFQLPLVSRWLSSVVGTLSGVRRSSTACAR